jgi:hypothetical protein
MTIPFKKPGNSRIFYGCQGVFIESRDTEAGNDGNPTGAEFLDGVQAVGISYDTPSSTLPDVGRFQRKYLYYQQQQIEITIERLLDKNKNLFYRIDDESYYPDYQQTHFLNANNFGSRGAKDNNNKTLRNYDVTVLYTPEKFGSINGGATFDTNPDTPEIEATDPDKDNAISVTYPNCLITSINYNFDVGSRYVRESITLVTNNIKYNDDYTDVTAYTMPSKTYGDAAPWVAGRLYTEGNMVSSSTFHPNIVFECTSFTPLALDEVYNQVSQDVLNFPTTGRLGRSGTTEPSWNYTAGATTSDGDITWTARERVNLLKPEDLDLVGPNEKSLLPLEVEKLFLWKDEDGNADSAFGNSDQIRGIQNISIEISIDYTSLSDVGIWRGSEDGKEYEQNRWKIVNVPVSVNCSFTGVTRQYLRYQDSLPNEGLIEEADENKIRNVDNIYTKARGKRVPTNESDSHTANRKIRLVAFGITDELFVWDLGEKNYVTSIEYSGGDTGGGNVEATINYSNQHSDFVAIKLTNGNTVQAITTSETY